MPTLVKRLALLLAAFAVLVVRANAETANEASLRAQVEALKAQVAAQAVRIQQLEQRNVALEKQDTAVALAVGEAPSKGPRIAPSSSLNYEQASKVATAARYMIPGAKLLSVMATGSMKPMFDERAVLIMEPAKFEDLRIGDVVTFMHPRLGMKVVHRIVEKRGNAFWTKGDNNGRMDDIYITRENYQARVAGVIYSNEAKR